MTAAAIGTDRLNLPNALSMQIKPADELLFLFETQIRVFHEDNLPDNQDSGQDKEGRDGKLHHQKKFAEGGLSGFCS